MFIKLYIPNYFLILYHQTHIRLASGRLELIPHPERLLLPPTMFRCSIPRCAILHPNVHGGTPSTASKHHHVQQVIACLKGHSALNR